MIDDNDELFAIFVEFFELGPDLEQTYEDARLVEYMVASDTIQEILQRREEVFDRYQALKKRAKRFGGLKLAMDAARPIAALRLRDPEPPKPD